jgi:hypothetical protein
MAAFKIVQKLDSLELPLSGINTTPPIPIKSGYFRIKPENDCYLEIGYTPVGVNTNTSLWVDKSETIVLKENIASHKVVGVFTGTSTTIDFPEGTSTPVEVNDYVQLTGIQPIGINTNFARVSSVNTLNGQYGYYSRRITLDWDTSSVSGIVTVNSGAEVRRTIKIAALDGGFGPNKIHITEIQITGSH